MVMELRRRKKRLTSQSNICHAILKLKSNVCCGWWEGWVHVNRLNHTSWMAVITPTDRPKSVRNRCVIEVCGGVFVLSIGF